MMFGNLGFIRICLLCGFTGCGRYGGGHSLEHYVKSCHNFSISLKEQFIWSYFTDNFVHRVSDKSAWASSTEARQEEMEVAQINEQNLLEANISALLCDQLDMQRKHYESKLDAKKQEMHKEIEEISDKQLKELSEKKENIAKQISQMKNQQMVAKKSKISHEQTLKKLSEQIEEELKVQANLKSHIQYLEGGLEEDAVLTQLNKDIQTQENLLKSFDIKLQEMYQHLS